MSHAIRSVLVVGGGTAGWLTASILAKQLHTGSPQNAIQVSLIESPNIPILGVGEGTWPTIRNTLRLIGIDESEFMRRCDASFKQGTEFVNWLHTAKSSLSPHRYYHPQGAVQRDAYDFNLAPYWLTGHAPNNLAYDHAVTAQSRVCEHNLAPKKITSAAYDAIQNYSYHLNAGKFAEFLTEHATQKLNVKHYRANILRVNQDELGNINSVTTDSSDNEKIDADFFVDCTGARAVLIGQALGVPWRAMNQFIFNDTALAMQVPYEHDDDEIKSHTIATAHSKGWTWDIGLSTRRGVGMVYSSQHCSDEEAEISLRQHIGPAAEKLEARKISFDIGFRQQFWHKNCVAIGMSAAFVEPLEASAIFMIEASAHMLADQFPRHTDAIASASANYNKLLSLRWEKTVDFIKLHYCLSQREDSDYWRDNRAVNSIPDTLKDRLSHWQHYLPSKYDFDFAYEPFVLDSYLFVLYGMQFAPTGLREHLATPYPELATKRFRHIQAQADFFMKELPGNRELVTKVHQYGFAKI